MPDCSLAGLLLDYFFFHACNCDAIYIYEHFPVLSVCERVSVWYFALPGFNELSTILFLKICALTFSY